MVSGRAKTVDQMMLVAFHRRGYEDPERCRLVVSVYEVKVL